VRGGRGTEKVFGQFSTTASWAVSRPGSTR